MQPSAVSVLRRFARPRQPRERCELCGAALAPTHAHLFEAAPRQIVCSCDACAILFDAQGGARYRRVPRRLLSLSGFQMPDELWMGMAIPVNMAFLCTSTASGGPMAYYPSPAGATEAFLHPESWERLVVLNSKLRDTEPDVEALLINRTGTKRDYYLAPIDVCFELVGIIRLFWRGLSGGQEVWQQIGRFFEDLESRATPTVERYDA